MCPRPVSPPLVVPRFMPASLQSSRGSLTLSMSMCPNFYFFIRTLVLLGEGATELQCDLILNTYIFNGFLSPQSCVVRYGREDFSVWILVRHSSTHNTTVLSLAPCETSCSPFCCSLNTWICSCFKAFSLSVPPVWNILEPQTVLRAHEPNCPLFKSIFKYAFLSNTLMVLFKKLYLPSSPHPPISLDVFPIVLTTF